MPVISPTDHRKLFLDIFRDGSANYADANQVGFVATDSPSQPALIRKLAITNRLTGLRDITQVPFIAGVFESAITSPDDFQVNPDYDREPKLGEEIIQRINLYVIVHVNNKWEYNGKTYEVEGIDNSIDTDNDLIGLLFEWVMQVLENNSTHRSDVLDWNLMAVGAEAPLILVEAVENFNGNPGHIGLMFDFNVKFQRPANRVVP